MTALRLRYIRLWRRSVLAAALLCAAAPLAAVGQDEHTHLAEEVHSHEPLAVDPDLDWPELLDTTLAAHPQSGELVARAAEADAWRRRGGQWLAAAPALYFSYLSDRPRDDQGQRQYDAGVELPLWRAGQRSAVRAVAASATAESGAAAAALRLEVAGLLRGTLWDIAAAVNGIAVAEDAVRLARELVRVVEARAARGDLARADVLLARATLLERDQALVAARAALLDAERSYRSLTRLDRRPGFFAEVRSPMDALTASHPLIALADAALARAEAGLELADRDVRGPLTLAVGQHREYDPGGTLPRDSLLVELRVPVGGKSYGGAQAAGAARLAAGARAERGQLMRRLDLDLHEAEHTLTVVEESTALATERAALAEQQLGMAETAFAQGEIELRELLRVQEAALAARRDVERLALERSRTIAALNQALGEAP